MTLSDPRRFNVQLVDKDGRTNKLATEIVVNVTRNHPPVVKMTQPAHDVRVSPVEELKLKAELEDDFGLVRHGLSYSMAGGEPREIVLQSADGRQRQVHAEHMLDFEALRAVPDQLVTYFFWAEDIGPDGQPRRTSGDMYLRRGPALRGDLPPGRAAAGRIGRERTAGRRTGQRPRADQLAELQKEIINGTWKLIRRETGAKPTDKLAEDGKVLQESQQSAIEQADQLAERLHDAASKASLEQATRLMKDAEKHLTEVADNASIAALNPALAAEQAAYQALLKLRAREFEVIRNNSRRQQQSGRSSGGRLSQRQLQQLELTTTRTATKSSARRAPDKRTCRSASASSAKPPGAQPAARAGPAPDRPERTAQGAAIGPRSGQDRAGARRRSSDSSSGSGTSSSRSSATPTSCASGWNTRRTATEWPRPASRSSRAASTSARPPRRSRKAGCRRPSPKAHGPAGN